MNTVQHKKKAVIRHELTMAGPITARDLHDFVFQVDQMYEEVTGKALEHDDAYLVSGDESGLTATFETKVKS